jgi:ketosteroid isomerase-like protein
MGTSFETPADAEDAYYDAIDDSDLAKMMEVWSDSPEATCLLPMQTLQQGPDAIRELWQTMLDKTLGLDITINHITWIACGDVAIHLLEEMVSLGNGKQRQPPIYATNVYRRKDAGWQLLIHVNSPSPPPPGMMPPLP